MNRDKKKEIIKKYNSTAYFYENRYSKIQKSKHEIALDKFDHLNKIILDAGCGTGLLYDFILNYKSKLNARFISLDISLKMLDELKIKLNSYKGEVNVFPILSDIESLPLREHIFDSVISITALQNLPNINKGLNEIIRIAKKGAKIYLSLLKKDLRLESFIQSTKLKLGNLKIFNNNDLEDLILKGEIL